jgi:hypothetical protein
MPAIRETPDYLNKALIKGNKLVILNIQSEFPALSEYIINELTANTVNDRIFSVVNRLQLNTIHAELEFQTSSEVDGDTAQVLGHMVGAQIIIFGVVFRIGDLYRLRIRALSVQTAQIEDQFNRNILDTPTFSAQVQSQATGYGNESQGGAARPPAQTAQDPAPTAPAESAILEAVEKIYKIVDTGPARGLIFYDKGVITNGWRYMEAVPNDIVPRNGALLVLVSAELLLR